MSPLDAALVAVVLALPLFWLVLREFDRLDDPSYLHDHGVVILVPDVLEAHSGPIGRYMDNEIWGSVTFKGMLYRFDHVARERERERISARELYLSPGLVYVTS